MNLSVIVPALNEEINIGGCLAALRNSFTGEIIVVDGGSRDGTVKAARPLATRVIEGPRGLALQCNRGASEASSDIIFFVAADCRVPPRWHEVLTRSLHSRYVVAGGFRLLIDDPSPIFRLLTWGGNFRSRYLRIALPDQGLFIRRSAFESIGGMKEDSLIPHARLCFEIKRVGDFILLPEAMSTSSRQWRESGVLATTARHMWTYLKFRYRELPHYL